MDFKNYFGAKQLLGTPLNLGDYNNYRGWVIPGDEDPNREGYLVKYEDGYESWSPKEVFEEAYREITNLTFGLAVEALKKGLKVSREGWNGKGLFIFKQVPANIGVEIIPKMQSVPESVKQTMLERSQSLNYRNQCVIVDVNGNVDNWAPSISDAFAEDWKIVE